MRTTAQVVMRMTVWGCVMLAVVVALGLSMRRAVERAGPRKCLQNGQLVYTNGPCPAGSREQALAGGTLTVVPAAPGTPDRQAAAAASRPANVRDLLVDPQAADLKARRIEAVVDR